MQNVEIKQVIGRQIIDSRGNPTVEAEVILSDGTVGRGASPSGASTGKFEALELRDNDKSKFCGKGVSTAIKNINDTIAPALIGKSPLDISDIDHTMISLDGTKDKSNLGANSILAVSLATTKSAANTLKLPLYKFIGGAVASTLPVPMMNILNGGAHANNSVDTQEFMIMPIGACCFSEGLRQSTEVFHALQELLKSEGFTTAVGDEGGFAPNLKSDEDAITHILKAVEKAGYTPGEDFVIALDAASSEWKSNKGMGYYKQPKSGKEFTSDELIKHWEKLISQYPIYSIEDGLDEDDWDGWNNMTTSLGKRVQLVGDDLFVTNTARLKKGINSNVANSILIKLNQIGTVTETINTIKMAQSSGYTAVVSHRSGETEDTFIADLSVALNCGQIKTGAPSRTERVAKYNQLLRIEEQLHSSAEYLGKLAFKF